MSLNIVRGGGTAGQKGWSPVLAFVAQGDGYVLQVTSWSGGEGVAPATGYVAQSGLTSDPTAAVLIGADVADATAQALAATNAAQAVVAAGAAIADAATGLQTSKVDKAALADPRSGATLIGFGGQTLDHLLRGLLFASVGVSALQLAPRGGDLIPNWGGPDGEQYFYGRRSTKQLQGNFNLHGQLQRPGRSWHVASGPGDVIGVWGGPDGEQYLYGRRATRQVGGNFNLLGQVQRPGLALRIAVGPGDVVGFWGGRDGEQYLYGRRATRQVAGNFDLHRQLQRPGPSVRVAPAQGDVIGFWGGPDGEQYIYGRKSTRQVHGNFNIDGSRPLPLTTSYFPLAAADVPAAADWNGVHADGESLSVGYSGIDPATGVAPPPISTSSPYRNLTFGSGPKSGKPGNGYGAGNTAPGTSTVIPLVESVSAADGFAADESETTCSGTANYATELAMLESGVPLTCFASTAGHGGYRISQLQKGQPWYANLIDHVSEATARATAAGLRYLPQAIPLILGHNNAILATNGVHDDGSPGQTPSNARAEFLNGLRSYWANRQADIAAATGQNNPVHLLMYQTASLIVPSQGAITLAQTDFINSGGPRVHAVRPIYDLEYIADGTHLTPMGYLRLGRAHGRAVKQLLVEHRAPDCIWPIAAVGRGNQVRCRYQVPRTPLVLDLSGLAPTAQWGYRVIDAAGDNAVVGAQVVLGDVVGLTLARPLQGAWSVRYAYDYLGVGLNIVGGASGNLRDSSPGTYQIAGVSYPKWHPAPHHQLTGFTLDPNS